MKQLNLKNLGLFVMCLASMSILSMAGAQTVRHDFMDANAARRDIQNLKVDRARALRFKNWGKVAQDDRLISSDRFWIMKDKNKIRRAGVLPPK
jgi:hypothetical protein